MSFVSNGLIKILVVEDNDDTAKAELDTLNTLGFKVERMESGEGVVNKVCAFRPDAIVLDIELPGKNGFEIAHELVNVDHVNKMKVPIFIFSVHLQNLADAKKDKAGNWEDVGRNLDINIIDRESDNALLKLVKNLCVRIHGSKQILPASSADFLRANITDSYTLKLLGLA